jgi:hypothetical protein
VLRLQRLGHKRKDIDDFYAHVTPAMREKMLAALQERWERSGGQRGSDPRPGARRGVNTSDHEGVQQTLLPICSPHADGLPMKIINRPSDQAKHAVGDTGIEPVTSSV